MPVIARVNQRELEKDQGYQESVGRARASAQNYQRVNDLEKYHDTLRMQSRRIQYALR